MPGWIPELLAHLDSMHPHLRQSFSICILSYINDHPDIFNPYFLKYIWPNICKALQAALKGQLTPPPKQEIVLYRQSRSMFPPGIVDQAYQSLTPELQSQLKILLSYLQHTVHTSPDFPPATGSLNNSHRNEEDNYNNYRYRDDEDVVDQGDRDVPSDDEVLFERREDKVLVPIPKRANRILMNFSNSEDNRYSYIQDVGSTPQSNTVKITDVTSTNSDDSQIISSSAPDSPPSPSETQPSIFTTSPITAQYPPFFSPQPRTVSTVFQSQQSPALNVMPPFSPALSMSNIQNAVTPPEHNTPPITPFSSHSPD